MKRQRKLVPPPEKVTFADGYRFVLGLISIGLGITILVRSIAAGIITPPAIIIGVAFLAFGTYRTYVGIVRYRQYRGMLQRGKGRS
jgi:hypothetical protein